MPDSRSHVKSKADQRAVTRDLRTQMRTYATPAKQQDVRPHSGPPGTKPNIAINGS